MSLETGDTFLGSKALHIRNLPDVTSGASVSYRSQNQPRLSSYALPPASLCD